MELSELEKKKPLHFIGIGGVGMSALASYFLDGSHAVKGSDLSSSKSTEWLKGKGAKIYFGQKDDQVESTDLVIYSSDIKEDNPELVSAKRQGCPLYHRSDLLAWIANNRYSIGIAGTHGKTTTTALCAWVFHQCGVDPSYAIGGHFQKSLIGNGYQGRGEPFIFEADESDGTFTKYAPAAAIITNVGSDHLEHYGSQEGIVSAFEKFSMQVKDPSKLFYHADHEQSRGIRYGLTSDCALYASNVIQEGWTMSFTAHFSGKTYDSIRVAGIGRHTVLNGLAVFGLALAFGLPEAGIRSALETFPGVKRRCERINSLSDVTLIDDYAHHPREIETTLKGIADAVFPRKVIAIFQPHRFTRTRDCMGSFYPVFDAADQVIITDIYPAREKPIEGIKAEAIVDELHEKGNGCSEYIPQEALLEAVFERIRPMDVVVTLGAGDITRFNSLLDEKLRSEPLSPLKVAVITGGKSPEHPVALMSAEQVEKGLASDHYAVSRLVIDRQGQWSSTETTDLGAIVDQLRSTDVAIPVLHGPHGEDGAIQGFLETIGVNFVGGDHRSCAIAMDKALTKRLLSAHSIPVLPFFEFTFTQWKNTPDVWLRRAKEELNWPVFVKPLHLGSTFGIQKVDLVEDLPFAIATAFHFDDALLIEEGCIGGREIEFALYGNEQPVCLPPGEIFSCGRIYDYAGKYSDHPTPCAPVADLSEPLKREGMEIAKKVYSVLGCSGFCRIDFFLTADGKYFLNEVNPIPGFTKTSLYPMMCEAQGISRAQIVQMLVLLARKTRECGRKR